VRVHPAPPSSTMLVEDPPRLQGVRVSVVWHGKIAEGHRPHPTASGSYATSSSPYAL